MKLCIIIGTRPEVIKLSPVIHECQKNNLDFFIIHSNQHYSPSMDEVFFNELNLPSPKYNLNVGSGKHSNQTGNILIKIEPILEEEKPDYVLVQGDTNTVLAGALAGSKLDIKVCHVEAGLRSYDRSMPEETNRVVTDHISNFLFAVTENQKNILINESIEKEKVHVVGNTITDAVLNNIKIAEAKSSILSEHHLEKNNFVLLTAHRASNVDKRPAFQKMINVIETITKNENVIWPIHPRAKKNLELYNLELPENIKLIEPIGYLDFLMLQKHAKIALTDSGGVQEETCILGTPCLTLRENTERPETVDVGGNIIIGNDIERARWAMDEMLSKKKSSWTNPFGDGTTSKQIINILKADFYGIPTQYDASPSKGTICVVGLGYMGLPMACILANSGYQVTGMDINTEKVESINTGKSPFEEEGLTNLLETAISNDFTSRTSITPSETYIISVPTPEKDKDCDLTYVETACENLVPHLEENNLVIIESTIKPGVTKKLYDKYFSNTGKKILMAHCPERAIPGNTLFELINNDRLVGGLTDAATEKAFEIYSNFSNGTVFKTSAGVAECCKLMENTFRDVNIALANEFDLVLKEHGVNVWEAIELANKHPRVNILSPGPGVGGHCIAIDPWFLAKDSQNAKLIPMAREINNNRPLYIAQEVKRISEENDVKNIAVLGVAYKKNVDDARETPSLHIIEALVELGLKVRATDPYVKSFSYPLENENDIISWADIIVIATDHDVYKNIDLKGKILIDTRNLI